MRRASASIGEHRRASASIGEHRRASASIGEHRRASASMVVLAYHADQENWIITHSADSNTKGSPRRSGADRRPSPSDQSITPTFDKASDD
jgi:hypothetical protein